MKFAIQGHSTRGREVIQILESLGGKTVFTIYGFDERYCYYVNPNGIIIECLITIETKDKFSLYTLEEFEKEFPFKIGDFVQTKPYDIPAKIIGLCLNPVSIITYKIRYASGVEGLHSSYGMKLYKEMKEERNITLTLDKAKEWYKKGGELREIALQAFTEKELNPLPRSWDEFCRKYEFSCLSTRYSNFPLKYDSLFKLEQLRDCWRQGWEPDWNDDQQTKYCVVYYREEFKINILYNTSRFLSFPTIEMAEEFLECFRDLIEKAGDLI